MNEILSTCLASCSKTDLIAMISDLTSENVMLKAKTVYSKVGNPFFCDYTVNWLEKYRYTWQLTTYDGYCGIIKSHIAPWFSDKQITLRCLTTSDIEEYYSSLLQKGFSPNTVKRHHANIRRCLRTACKDGLIPSNPALLADLPAEQKSTVEYLSELEYRQLLKYSKFTEMYPVILLTSMGLRRSEALGVKWSDIDFSTGILKVMRKVVSTRGCSITICDKLKNGTSHRDLNIPAWILNELSWIYDRQCSMMQKNISIYSRKYLDFVCVSSNGNLISPNLSSEQFRFIADKCGEMHGITLKGLRHSCATILLANGCELKHIQEWLGHSTIVVTANTYAHVDMTHKRQIAEKLNAAILCS